jgi:uncharacterized CHY-type Zn-finger protein
MSEKVSVEKVSKKKAPKEKVINLDEKPVVAEVEKSVKVKKAKKVKEVEKVEDVKMEVDKVNDKVEENNKCVMCGHSKKKSKPVDNNKVKVCSLCSDEYTGSNKEHKKGDKHTAICLFLNKLSKLNKENILQIYNQV